VEASKFTEVGYVGRDVEGMVRDLVDAAVNLVRTEREDEVYPQAEAKAEEKLLDLLLPPGPEQDAKTQGRMDVTEGTEEEESRKRSREKLRALLRDGKLDDREVEIEVTAQGHGPMEMMPPPQGMEGPDFNFTEWLQQMMPKGKKRRMAKIPDARRILIDEELRRMVDMDDTVNEALDRTENHGIVFIDELDKIAGERNTTGPDISREGVQRDLLPIVEGSTVQTRYGYVRTDHVLFIAAGAFHVSKPSDLIPELQGRFPIRVELTPLGEEDFVRIMTEPENALTKQYAALVAAEGATLDITPDGVREIARIATLANTRMGNIGARRLHTVMSTLMDEVLFELPGYPEKQIVFNAEKVKDKLAKVIGDDDLRRYIL
jgi:ATP-dependent HslUV protease ATP-binding subunit HslU